MTRRKKADLYLRYSSGDYYIRQCHLGPMRKLDAAPALVKKLKLRIIPAKSKKRPIITPVILDETENGKEISLIDKLENE
jgi:hypothetical protein